MKYTLLFNERETAAVSTGSSFYKELRTCLKTSDSVDCDTDFILMQDWYMNEISGDRISKIKNHRAKKICFGVDFGYRMKKSLETWEKLGIDLVLTRNDMKLVSEWRHPKIKITYFPISFDKNVFKCRGLKKVYDIGMLGRWKGDFYPMRERVHKMLLKSNLLYFHSEGLSDWSDKGHPANPFPSQEKYAEAIGRCKIVFVDGQIRHTLVYKYNEVPACNTLLLSPALNSGELEKHGFSNRQNIFLIDPADSNETILSSIWELVKNEKRLQEMSSDGHKLVHSKHTNAHRAKELEGVIKNAFREDAILLI